MIDALLTKEDIRKFIFDAICKYGNNKLLDCLGMMEYFKINRQQLNKYIQQGLPWVGKETRKHFNLNECKRWFDAHRREL